MWMKRMALLLWVLSVGSCGAVAPGMAFSGMYPTRCETGHPDTNPAQISEWFRALKNRGREPCCSEGDGYPAIIDQQASPGHTGHGYIVDGSAKEIWSQGCLIKTRPKLLDDAREFTFTWDKMVPEAFGNPVGHAFAFVYPSGTMVNGVTKNGLGVHCVVPLPPIF